MNKAAQHLHMDQQLVGLALSVKQSHTPKPVMTEGEFNFTKYAFVILTIYF